MTTCPRRCCYAAVATLLVLLPGCNWGRRELPPEPPPRPAVVADPYLEGTIGALTYLGNAEGQIIRGFGVVIGLGENGSTDCPTIIRDHLMEIMTKEAETWGSLQERQRFSPAELIDSQSTAVVEVSGLVPAGAPADTRLDIQIAAIPGTSTRSLAGGLLLPCELRLPEASGDYEELLGGPIVARAGGPVFVDPFVPDADDPRVSRLPVGTILGGGWILSERPTRLLLQEPSYPIVRRLRDRINERLGQRHEAAESMSRGYLVLHTPSEYAAQPSEFLQLVTHLYLDTHPTFVERKTRELIDAFSRPGADFDRIALVLEGIGPTVVPYIQPLYAHSDAAVRCYAARTGLRLEDVTALPVLDALAAWPDKDIALQAIYELGRCRYPQAANPLAPLLDSDDTEIRIAAYNGLRHHRHPKISSRRYPMLIDPLQLNVVLDIVDCRGEPLIYVRRTGVPRIAVFGARMPVRLPVFYVAEDDSVTVTADDVASDLTLFAKRRGVLSDPLHIPPRVTDLVTALADLPADDDDTAASRHRGLGLPYSQVAQILGALCDSGAVPAKLEVELGRAGAPQRGPEAVPERPETDSVTPPPPPPAPTEPDNQDEP
ncbi:MAG: flagellar basal body P-ring protein FlgI [Phycisphaerae bacterium]|jgi:hypothetical protein